MDKLAKVKAEVVRMHNLLPIMDGDNIYVNYADRICTTLEMYIDSLQEEPVSKEIGDYDHKAVMEALHPELKEDNVSTSIDFEQELYKNFGQVKDFTLAVKIAKKFYEMGKLSNVESNVKNWKEEPISEDWECKDNSEELNEAARQIVPKVLSCEATAFYTEDDIVLSDEEECFKAGARWQKQHSKCPLDCPAFSDGYKIGMKEAKQQMMKDAFECKVKVDAGGYPYIPQMELYDYYKDEPLAKEGDKYKVILIKEN